MRISWRGAGADGAQRGDERGRVSGSGVSAHGNHARLYIVCNHMSTRESEQKLYQNLDRDASSVRLLGWHEPLQLFGPVQHKVNACHRRGLDRRPASLHQEPAAVGQRLRFPLKPREAVRIGGERVGQNFQRDVAVQFRIARAIHFAHAAHADLAGAFVDADAGAWTQRHESYRTGTSRFSSSNQCCTTMIALVSSTAFPDLIITKRWPSGLTSNGRVPAESLRNVPSNGRFATPAVNCDPIETGTEKRLVPSALM